MSIGRTLTDARERAGLSVEDVAEATRIRRTLVSSIEADDFSRCGGDFYARGHLRTIAATVGVDPRPLLAAFDRARPAGEAVAPRASAVFEFETAARPERHGPNWSAAMAVALVLVLGYGVVQVLAGPGERQVTEGLPRSSPPTVVEPSATSTPRATSSAVARVPRDRVTVKLTTDGTSWVQASTGSGRQLFEGLLEDESRVFTAPARVRLVVGNAGAVTLTVNGQDLGSPGEPGQVARVEFTREDPGAG